MTPHVDPMKTFDHSFGRTEDLTTFMQQNIFTIDLGYVTNVAYTERLHNRFIFTNHLKFLLLSGKLCTCLRMISLQLKCKSD